MLPISKKSIPPSWLCQQNLQFGQDDTSPMNELGLSQYPQEFATEVLTGLSHPLKWLPTKYIYDDTGSELFRRIMDLPEYYLTRCEVEVLENHRTEMREALSDYTFNLVELGAGDGKKTRILLKELLNNRLEFHYIPIDISKSAINGLLKDLTLTFSELKMEGLVTEYFDGLRRLRDLNRRRNVVLFLGSSIGNFTPSETQTFLSNLWHALNDGDYVMIGFDLKKDIEIMLKAYADSQGVTAQFNLNLLKRINQELGGNFDLNQFHFYSTYDPFQGAIQSYVISQKEQKVFIEGLNRSFSFVQWEAIHTESSYKFRIEDIEQLAHRNQFEVVAHFSDSRKYFVDTLWKVRKPAPR